MRVSEAGGVYVTYNLVYTVSIEMLCCFLSDGKRTEINPKAINYSKLNVQILCCLKLCEEDNNYEQHVEFHFIFLIDIQYVENEYYYVNFIFS